MAPAVLPLCTGRGQDQAANAASGSTAEQKQFGTRLASWLKDLAEAKGSGRHGCGQGRGQGNPEAGHISPQLAVTAQASRLTEVRR